MGAPGKTLRSRRGTTPRKIDAQVEHECDHGKVNNEKASMQQSYSMHQQSDLDRKIKRARNQRNPLRPSSGAPQPIGFHEAQSRITASDGDYHPDFGVAQTVRHSQQQLRKVAVRADVKQLQKPFRQVLGVDEKRDPERRPQYQQAFDELHQSHRARRLQPGTMVFTAQDRQQWYLSA